MMNTKIKSVFLSLGVVLSVVALPVPSAYAAPASGGCPTGSKQTVSFFPAWYDGLTDDKGNVLSPGDPCLGSDSGKRFGKWLTIIAMNIVSMLLYIVGYASLIFIIYGGFKYMINGDNSGGTVAARKTIQNAVIGLVLSIMSVSLVSFIASRIAE